MGGGTSPCLLPRVGYSSEAIYTSLHDGSAHRDSQRTIQIQIMLESGNIQGSRADTLASDMEPLPTKFLDVTPLQRERSSCQDLQTCLIVWLRTQVRMYWFSRGCWLTALYSPTGEHRQFAYPTQTPPSLSPIQLNPTIIPASSAGGPLWSTTHSLPAF